MFINWGIEIFKWKLLTTPIVTLPVSTCIKGVISGVTISMFLPNRIGDVAGKILWLQPDVRWKGFFANIYASFAQVLATLLLSATALTYFYLLQIPFFVRGYMASSLTLLLLAVLIVLFIAYFHLGFFSRLLGKIRHRWFVRISENIKILGIFSLKIRLIVIFLSILRFVVYSIQFYLLLRLFGFIIPFTDGLMLIFVVYLFITIVPQFAIAEIATRGALTILVFDLYNQSTGILPPGYEAILLLASTSLWFVNLFLPAMAGLSMLPGLKRIISNAT
jgi:hypothetical protein